ncbi:MAG: monovalent cation/H(+) antiporter subunit G [Bacteroidales bacterium]
MINDWIGMALLIIGSLFMLVAAIGLVRLPDIYLRMHAATKAPSLGLFFMVLAVPVHFLEWWPAVEAVFILLIIFITLPIGSHMIAQAAHLMNVTKSKRTFIDQMEATPEGNRPASGQKATGSKHKGRKTADN